MSKPTALLLSGIAGLVVAALVYLLGAALIGGPVLTLPAAAEILVFAVLLVFEIIEIPIMVFFLRTLGSQEKYSLSVLAINVAYVSFSAYYALVQVFLFGESPFSRILAGVSLVRWLTDFLLVAPSRQARKA